MPRGVPSKTGRKQLGGRNPPASYQRGVQTFRSDPAARLKFAQRRDKVHPNSWLYIRTDKAHPNYVRLGVSLNPIERLRSVVKDLFPTDRPNHAIAYVLQLPNAYSVEQQILLSLNRFAYGEWLTLSKAKVKSRIEELTGLEMLTPERAGFKADKYSRTG